MEGCRVAMVAACPFPANYGSPAAVREMAEALGSLGHSVFIVTYPFGEDLPVANVTLSRCWYWRKSSRIYSGPSLEKILLDIFLLLHLCRVIRREKISLVHAHNYEGVLVGFAARLLTGCLLLYSASNLMSDELPMYKFVRPAILAKLVARILDSVVARIPSAFIVISAELHSALIARRVPPDRITLIPLGIELAMFDHASPDALRERYAVRDRPVVMYTGINSPIQRLDYLLRAFCLVLNDIPEALLMIVSPLSHDFDLPANRILAKSLGVSHSVIWVEGHSLRELPDYLAMASVAVVSRPEVPGHPIKLLNYMAAGKPIVCPAGTAKGLRHMHDALIVADHRPRELAGGIVRLLRDRCLADALGANARITVAKNFDRLKLCRPVEAIYRLLTKAETEPIESPPAPEHCQAVEIGK